jgi:hypothetical protein
MKYFKVQELVPESVYRDRGERSIQLIDNRIVKFIEGLRDALGRSITVNDWLWGGEFAYRGLRDSNSSVYSKYSQHSFGRAIDFDVKGMTSQEVREWIIDNRDVDFVKPITFIEGSVNWVHVDCRGGTGGDLWLWDVKTGKTEIFKRG